MEELVFNIRHTVYWVDTRLKEAKEFPPEFIAKLYGQTLRGDAVYQGNIPRAIAPIKNPLLFVRPDDFRDIELFKKAAVPEKRKHILKIIDFSMPAWVECYVIAPRQNFKLT
ncbi:MAG: hypothetical protein PHE24_04555 [Patescibacteria group bacterium]|nr:hypothetical protein [Patescibacteria group bacterium]